MMEEFQRRLNNLNKVRGLRFFKLKNGNGSATKLKFRKNFFPGLLVTFAWWLVVGLIIFFFEPNSTLAIVGFFVLIFLALFFTFTFVFTNKRRGLIASIGAVFYLFLRYLGIGNIYNFVIIVALGITTEVYLTKFKS
jgi:hypothetical protein